MAAAKAPRRQPEALGPVEAFYGLQGVIRAARLEATAWPQQGATESLVRPKCGDNEGFHWFSSFPRAQSCKKSLSASARLRQRQPGLSKTTKS